jgi:hypothetical protein
LAGVFNYWVIINNTAADLNLGEIGFTTTTNASCSEVSPGYFACLNAAMINGLVAFNNTISPLVNIKPDNYTILTYIQALQDNGIQTSYAAYYSGGATGGGELSHPIPPYVSGSPTPMPAIFVCNETWCENLSNSTSNVTIEKNFTFNETTNTTKTEPLPSVAAPPQNGTLIYPTPNKTSVLTVPTSDTSPPMSLVIAVIVIGVAVGFGFLYVLIRVFRPKPSNIAPPEASEYFERNLKKR